jgi:hypothetical protein
MITKWAHRVGYSHLIIDIPSLGLTEEIKQQEQDELHRLILSEVSMEESSDLRSALEGRAPRIKSKHIFNSARQSAIRKAKDSKRTDLVLALERFKWPDLYQAQR